MTDTLFIGVVLGVCIFVVFACIFWWWQTSGKYFSADKAQKKKEKFEKEIQEQNSLVNWIKQAREQNYSTKECYKTLRNHGIKRKKIKNAIKIYMGVNNGNNNRGQGDGLPAFITNR